MGLVGKDGLGYTNTVLATANNLPAVGSFVVRPTRSTFTKYTLTVTTPADGTNSKDFLVAVVCTWAYRFAGISLQNDRF